MKENKHIYTDHNGIAVICDEPGHAYHVSDENNVLISVVSFQDGPIKEAGINGMQNEHLIAILVDRLEFLDSKFPCDSNKAAITNLKNALEHLEARTKNRIARNVEGTNTL